MKREELRKFILSFDNVSVEKIESQKVEIFRVDLELLAQKSKSELENTDDLGEFEQMTHEKIVANFESAEEKNPIFAILHESEFPVIFEIKTGSQLAGVLRERESVMPSKLMNGREWNKIIGFGQVSEVEAQDLIRLSYRLVSE